MPLRRINTIATSEVVPRLVTLPRKPHKRSASFAAATSSSSTISSSSSSSFSSNLSYISLKEIISGFGGVNSPPAASKISIRNHLVKQAAWAYLQPMSTSPESATDNLYRRVATGILTSPVFSLLRTAASAVVDAFRLCFL